MKRWMLVSLRNVRKTISRFGRVWRDAVQGAPERRVASHTSEGQRSNAPARHDTNREIVLRTFLIALSTLLAGCATPTIRSHVTVFQNWPTDMQGQPFVFERTLDQNNNLEYRAYENLVRVELQRLGFAEATAAQSPALKVTMGYSIQGRDVRVVQPVIVDPFWYGGYPFYYPGWDGYYGPLYGPSWYGPPMMEYRDESYTLYKRQLRVLLFRASDSKKLYDVTVDSEGRNGSLAAVMPYMVRSAFEGFPARNGETRRIELEMKD